MSVFEEYGAFNAEFLYYVISWTLLLKLLFFLFTATFKNLPSHIS